MSSKARFEIGFGPIHRDHGADRKHEASLRVLVLGDLSGRRSRSEESPGRLSDQRVRTVDVDNFDAVLARIAPTVALRNVCGLAQLTLSFGSLEDFHPDQLAGSIEACRDLRASRARLMDPATRVAEARRLTVPHPGPAEDVGSAAGEDREALLERLIGTQPRELRGEPASSGVVDRLIRQVLGPSGDAETGPAPEPYVSAIDAVLSEWLRAVLHDPGLQSLESTWRGLRRFVESVDLGDNLKLQVLDASKDELLHDLVTSGSNLCESEACRTLAGALEDSTDAGCRTLLVGLYRFGATEADVSLLERLAELAATLQSPLIADAEAALAGCRSLRNDTDPRNWSLPDEALEARWQALRRGPSARWLGLALPRVLARLPYGARTEPVESFTFDELSGEVAHENLLWGSAALACAQGIAVASMDGGEFIAGSGSMEIEDLPVFTQVIDGETVLQPCAEYLLPSRLGEALYRRGMIPLLSHADRNAVRILGVQSVADPWSPLGDVAGAASGANEG